MVSVLCWLWPAACWVLSVGQLRAVDFTRASRQKFKRENRLAGQKSRSSVTCSWKWPPIASAVSSWGVSSATLREFHESMMWGCLHRSLHTTHAQAGWFVTSRVHTWKTVNGLWLYFSLFPLQPELFCDLLSSVAAMLICYSEPVSVPPSLMYQEVLPLVWTGYLAALRGQKKPDPAESRSFRKFLISSDMKTGSVQSS